MADGAELTTVEAVHEDGSFLFTATNSFDMDEEYEFEHEGAIDDGDGPSSTSHIGF